MTVSFPRKAGKYFDNLSPTGVSYGEQMDTGVIAQQIPQEGTLHQWGGFLTLRSFGKESRFGGRAG